ncbi:hypothetical protein BOTBODRAFT_179566 [Botryobasidium botryosum FD-172 SS1]|uniref:Uncharacterized protein n=1 Tax=Botryobasidium botryosum (strain FD-172 SS1) TaxID=930990 RepID=A0A067MAA9_BOTB1|nr:hypothetical protein BOTBODRAFT_179566 [Botryobasidium botryosum FD-172 SS1]
MSTANYVSFTLVASSPLIVPSSAPHFTRSTSITKFHARLATAVIFATAKFTTAVPASARLDNDNFPTQTESSGLENIISEASDIFLQSPPLDGVLSDDEYPCEDIRAQPREHRSPEINPLISADQAYQAEDDYC